MKTFVFILRPGAPAQPFMPVRTVVVAPDIATAQAVALQARALANPALYDCYDLTLPAPQPTIVACERFIPLTPVKQQSAPSISAPRDQAKYAELDDGDVADMGGDGLPGDVEDVRVQGGILQ